MPLAFNLDYDMNIDMSHAGEIANSQSLNKKIGGVSKKTNYAYLMEWHEYYTPNILNEILNNDMIAKVSLKNLK